MPITVQCSCGRPVRARDDQAGTIARCMYCGANVDIPGAAVAARATRVPSPTRSSAPAPVDSASEEPQDELRLISLNDDKPALREPSQFEPPVLKPAGPRAHGGRTSFPRSAPPPVVLQTDDHRSRQYQLRYCLLVLTFLPLFIGVLQKDDNLAVRVDRSVEALSEADRIRLVRLENEHAKQADILALFPNQRIEGAHLSAQTWVHWIYAAISAAAFCAAIMFLFPMGAASPAQLWKIGLFTGTVGILLLLAAQFMASWTSGIWIKGNVMLMIAFYVAKFIGFSYQCASDPNNGFWLSFFGFTFGIGLCEELCKALPLVHHFKEKAALDWRGACVWGLASGVGFGVCEGVMYSSDYYNGLSTGDIYVIRFASCVGLHAIWSASVGIALHRRQITIQNVGNWYEMSLPLIAILGVPMVMHGLYDTLLKQDYELWACGIAAISFAWLIFMIERARKEFPAATEEQPQPA
jgi:RsiW-degrading membrane proteinase PrsW (M82 family)